MPTSKTCPKCGGPMSFYAEACRNCKVWKRGLPGSRADNAARVAQLTGEGLTQNEIAARVGISRAYVSMLQRDPEGKAPRSKYKETPASIANQKRYRENNAEKIRERSKLSMRKRLKRPEVRAYYAAYREAHREEARRRTREWGRQNPERKRQQMETRRARLLNAPEIEKIDRAAVIARDKSICHICRKKVRPKDMSLDHLIPLSKGGPHTAVNLSVAHRSCNSKRHAGRLPAQLRLIA